MKDKQYNMFDRLKYWINRLLFSHQLGELIDNPIMQWGKEAEHRDKIVMQKEDWAFTTENDVLLQLGNEPNPFEGYDDGWDGEDVPNDIDSGYIEAKRKERGIYVPVKPQIKQKIKGKASVKLYESLRIIVLGSSYLIPKNLIEEAHDLASNDELLFIKIYREFLVESETF